MQQYVSFKDLLTFREHLDDVVTVTTCIQTACTTVLGYWRRVGVPLELPDDLATHCGFLREWQRYQKDTWLEQ